MNFFSLTKQAFSVIGKEGSTLDGESFIADLWADANEHFSEVAHLAKRDGDNLVGIWGVMTDFSRSFLPWEDNFSKGLYLAGVECRDDALPPKGWTRWTCPGFEYRCADAKEASFAEMLAALRAEGETLAGAVKEYTDPKAGKSYLCFPVKRL